MKFISPLRLALLAGVTMFAASHAEAQKSYVKIGGGYNFGLGSEIMYKATETTNYSGNGSPSHSAELERIDVNWGKGAVGGAALGYMFNKNIGLEIGVNYLKGSKTEFEDKETDINSSFGQSSLSLTTRTHGHSSQMVLIQPSVVIASDLPKFNPYTRFGMILAKGSIINTESITTTNPNGNHTLEGEAKLTGGLGLGLQAALGLNFSLNERIGIYTEATFNNLTYAPEKGEVTKYTDDGVDKLSTMETSQKEITFVDKESFSSGDPQQSPSEPSTGPKERYTLNSVGVNVGLKFNF